MKYTMTSTWLSSKRRKQLNKILSGTGDIITIDDTAIVLELSRIKTRALLQAFAKSGWLKRMRPGVYVKTFLETLDPSLSQEDSFTVSSNLFAPCYIGAWSAASHWGLTDQVFSVVWIFTARRFRKKYISMGNQYVLTHIKKSYLFGTAAEWINNQKILISDPHKTIIDFAEFVNQLGLTSFIDVFTTYMHSKYKNLSVLRDYILKSGNRTLFKRIGYLLEKNFPDEIVHINAYKSLISKGYSKIYSKVPCPKIVKRWNLRVPEEMD